MSKKSLLITSNDSGSELSRAFKRSLKFLLNKDKEEYNLEEASYNDSYSKSPDILLILDTNSHNSFYTDGIHFLRKYWAELIKKKDVSPPVISLSFNCFQDLIRKDPRHIVTFSEGVYPITIPFPLKNIIGRIEKNADKRIGIETLKKYLRWSCELKMEGIIEHAWKNFKSPHSLLRGACYVNDITGKTFSRMKYKIDQRGGKEANEEFDIYDAATRIEGGKSSTSKEDQKPSESLKKEFHNRRILLIDDEYETAGWKDALTSIFGNVVEAIGDPSWQKTEDVLNDEKVKTALMPDKHLLPYDLIFLDLRLTNKDKKMDGMRDANRFSCIQLLKAIREKDLTVPVILFTASNKVYNIKEAEKLKINGYFPKEVHYNYEEAGNYYLRFKELVQKLLIPEQKALREIWNGIEFYRSTIDNKEVTEKNEILLFLRNAYYLLSAYPLSSNPVYSRLAIVELGNIVEKLYGKGHQLINSFAYDNILESINDNSDAFISLHAFIAYQLRNSAAHSYSYITFEDALFAFLAIFYVLKVDIVFQSFKWKDPTPEWKFDQNIADRMIFSICNNVCNRSCHTFRKRKRNPKYYCKFSNEKNLNKAKFLSLEHNLRTWPLALTNQMLFRYLFYVLCLREIGLKIPEVILPLIKSRLTHGGKIYPPFRDGCWVGIKMNDGGIDSPLGILQPDMFSEKSADGDKVLFYPTGK